jgi:hypothetical protein
VVDGQQIHVKHPVVTIVVGAVSVLVSFVNKVLMQTADLEQPLGAIVVFEAHRHGHYAPRVVVEGRQEWRVNVPTVEVPSGCRYFAVSLCFQAVFLYWKLQLSSTKVGNLLFRESIIQFIHVYICL